MGAIRQERFSVRTDSPFLVFMVGMRVNQLTAVRKAYFVASEFVNMQHVLADHPEKGCLHGELFFRLFPFTTTFMSYWRSFDDLEHFARAKDDVHLAAWQQFYRKVGTDGTIGIWHETYTIQPGNNEAIYVNMPPFGLGAAMKEAVVSLDEQSSARGRIRGEAQTQAL